MATSKSSGDIQLPSCPLTPGFGIGTASRCDGVEMNVLDSTRATSRGSVCARKLNQITWFIDNLLILKIYVLPVVVFRQRLDDALGDQNVEHQSVFFVGSVANVDIRRLTQVDIVFQKSQYLFTSTKVKTGQKLIFLKRKRIPFLVANAGLLVRRICL